MSDTHEEEVSAVEGEKLLLDSYNNDDTSQCTNGSDGGAESPVNDELSEGEGSDDKYCEVEDAEEAHKIDSEETKGPLDIHIHKLASRLKNMFPDSIKKMGNDACTGEKLGEIKDLTCDQVRALNLIFLEVLNEFHIELVYKNGAVYGQAANIDSSYECAQDSRVTKESVASCSKPSSLPPVQVKSRQDPTTNSRSGDLKHCPPVVSKKPEKSKKTKVKCATESSKAAMESRYSKIIECYPWLVTKTRDKKPFTVMDYIRKYELNPSDAMLKEADKMKTDETKGIRLSLLMNHTLYLRTATIEAQKRYKEEIKCKKQK